MKDSLDGMPIHVRQLAEMFRKHGQKQNRNTAGVNDLDATDVPEALRNGWKKDGHLPNDVVGAGKGNRPDPKSYLDEGYIREHLDQFSEGATRIYKTDSIRDWGPGNNQAVDGSNTAYVFPTDQLDRVIKEADGDPHKLSAMLGLPDDFFVGADVQLRDFAPEDLAGLRMPSGNEGGTDVDHWIPGGYLPSGVPEAVIDIPGDATGFMNGDGALDQSRWPGSWRELNF
jgi:hypothetical protein